MRKYTQPILYTQGSEEPEGYQPVCSAFAEYALWYDPDQVIEDVVGGAEGIKNIDSKSKNDVIDILLSVESDYGEPRLYLSDQGGEFQSVDLLAEHVTTASYHPMTNGKIERFHSTLAEQCRIHETTPEIAVKYLRNEQKRINPDQGRGDIFSKASMDRFVTMFFHGLLAGKSRRVQLPRHLIVELPNRHIL